MFRRSAAGPNATRKAYSLLVSSNFNNRTFRASLSQNAARALLVLAGLGLILLLAALLLGRAGLYRTARLSYLELRNRQLEDEFTRVAELRQRLARLEAQERRYAEMLGVDLTPPPVDWGAAVVDTTDEPGPEGGDAWGSRPVPSLLPLDEFVLSRAFGRDHPGVDLAASSGASVRAAADAVVAARGTDSIFGNYLLLSHLEGFETYYAHLLEWRVEPGDSVLAGQVIAAVGSTGRSSAPHLHFEIRRRGRSLNPATLLALR